MGTHPIFESDFDCLTDFDPKSPGGMASPLAVLSEAAFVYEQMEKLKMDQLTSTTPYAHEPVASVPRDPVVGGGAAAAGGLPWVLVVPHPGLAHAQAITNLQALQAMHTNAYLAAITQRAAAATTAPTTAAPKLNSPPRQLALHPAGSISTGSLSTESEGYPPWHQQQQQQKPEVIVRNPNHHHQHHQVRMRPKKPKPSVEAHFRRSLGSYETNNQQNKRPSSMIEHSEVDTHFARVFGADEWNKIQAKRKKLNRHSVI